MARKTRRARRSSKGLVTWQRVIIVVAPVLAAFLLLTNTSNGRAVLGISDSNLFNFSKKEATRSAKPKPKPTCNRVISFSANTICDSNSSEKSNNSFSFYSYTCEDGTSGNVEQKEGRCVPVGKAYELAKKACQRKCITPKPTRPPEPTTSELGL